MEGHGDPGARGAREAENVGGLPSLKAEVIRHGPWQTLGWLRTLVEANL